MKFIDLNKQYQAVKASVDAGIQAVIHHGQFINGPEISALEKKLAQYVNTGHCVVTSSGTTALQIALMALDIKPGDEVITSPFSFFASAEVIVLLGAKPVFVDIDPITYNLDSSLLEKAITKKTKVIIPVSLYGQCADYDAINDIAKRYGLPVIEDAAQSFGATYKDRHSCALTSIACTSFFPSKPLACYGEGGACFTNDDQLANKIRMIIDHGSKQRYHHEIIGINGRLPSIQAAVLLSKLEIFDQELERRQQVAHWYAQALGDIVTPPYVEPYNKSVYAQYTIQVENRSKIQKMLALKNVPTAIHYPKGLHQQPALEKIIDVTQRFVHTEEVAEKVLSLPFHPYLSEEEVHHVGQALLNCLKIETV